MTEQSISQQASVAADVGTLKRSIQMKMFASKTDKAKVNLNYVDEKSPTFNNAEKSAITVGMIMGEIYSVKESNGTLPDGTAKMSLLAIGDFEATNYSTGEVWNSTSAYLPGYVLQTMKASLDAGARSLEFAVEIVLVPTGKEVPFAYEVRNLVRREPQSAINRLKLKLQAAGRLPAALPAPEAYVSKVEPIDEIGGGDVIEGAHTVVSEGDDEGATEADAEATGASQADGDAEPTGKRAKAKADA